MSEIEFKELLNDSESLIERYYNIIANSNIASKNKGNLLSSSNEFEPDFNIPELDAKMKNFLKPAKASIIQIGTYKEREINLLDLRQNPGTNTVKTFAATLMVARAINYIHKNNEKIIIFSPSSGNKAIALRDAVLRAIECELAEPEELRIITLTPYDTKEKLRSSNLSINSHLKKLNPAFVLETNSPEKVKEIGDSFKEKYSKHPRGNAKLWHSLKLENYRFADQVRAFYDYEFGSIQKKSSVHVHSVSSAYGLLGYKTGIDELTHRGYQLKTPLFLLVQHLATSDMVNFLITGSFEPEKRLTYKLDENGYFYQNDLMNYPFRTSDINEILEQTFYTHRPVTAVEMTDIIHNNGGNGIVVSLLECIERYASIKIMLNHAGIDLPSDPKKVKEWSLIMALTGTLNAIDRGLIPDIESYVIHGTGFYSFKDYKPLDNSDIIPVINEDQMLAYI